MGEEEGKEGAAGCLQPLAACGRCGDSNTSSAARNLQDAPSKNTHMLYTVFFTVGVISRRLSTNNGVTLVYLQNQAAYCAATEAMFCLWVDAHSTSCSHRQLVEACPSVRDANRGSTMSSTSRPSTLTGTPSASDDAMTQQKTLPDFMPDNSQ
ncbi:hypothetical protein PAMP_018717 [Pampus punctatissimus]